MHTYTYIAGIRKFVLNLKRMAINNMVTTYIILPLTSYR